MGKHRAWNAREMVPFSARMVVERLACGSKMRGGDVEVQSKEKEYVRVMVNDAVQPLKFCGGDSHGLCTVEEFVESQVYARNDGNGDFEKCFE